MSNVMAVDFRVALKRASSYGAALAIGVIVALSAVGGCNYDEEAGTRADATANVGDDVIVNVYRHGDSLEVVRELMGRDSGMDSVTAVRIDGRLLDAWWDSSTYRDSVVGDAPSGQPTRNVVVSVRSPVEADLVEFKILNDSARVLGVGGAAVTGPDTDLVREVEYRIAGRNRSLEVLIELPRCDSTKFEVVQAITRSHEKWDSVEQVLGAFVPDDYRIREIRYRTLPKQDAPLPSCCETTLRRRARRESAPPAPTPSREAYRSAAFPHTTRR